MAMNTTLSADELDKKLDEKFNEFGAKLFQYLDRRFDEVNERIDKVEQNFDRLQQTLDAFIKRVDDIETEDSARDAQLARLERWIEQIAEKTGVKLKYK